MLVLSRKDRRINIQTFLVRLYIEGREPINTRVMWVKDNDQERILELACIAASVDKTKVTKWGFLTADDNRFIDFLEIYFAAMVDNRVQVFISR